MKLRAWSKFLHKWLGLLLALWVLLMGVTGSVLLYKDALLKWQYPALALPAPVTQDRAALLLDNLRPPLSEGYAYLPTPSRPWLEVVTPQGTHWYLDEDGPVLSRVHRGDVMAWIVELHHDLALGETGKDLLGILGIASLLLVITGLLRWWPQHRFSLRLLSVRWYRPWTKRGLQTLWQLHRSIGVIAWLPIVLSLATGTAIMYAKPVNQALTILLPGQSADGTYTRPTNLAPATDWQTRFAAASKVMPQADVRLVYLQRARMRLKHPQEWHPNGRNYLAFDTGTGALTEFADVRASALGNQLSHTVYPLHVAAVGGPLLLTLVLLAGLALTLLPLTGIWYWLKRQTANG